MSTTLILFFSIASGGCQKAVPPKCRVAAGEADGRSGNAGCLIIDGRHLLALRHRFGGVWGIPGGASEANESAQCAAHRETWEETGLDVTVGERLHRFDNGFSLYRCRIDSGGTSQEIKTNDPWEVSAVEWIDPWVMSREDWRFPDQFSSVQQLVNNADKN